MNKTESSKTIRTLRIDLTSEQYQNLKEQAEQQKRTLKDYTALKLTGDTKGVQLLSDQIMQIMPAFYNLVSEVENESVRNELMDFGGAICRYLK